MKIVILLSLFLVGCKNYAQYKKSGEKVLIIPRSSAIASADLSDWRVGPLRRQKVSKGIRVKLNFPELEIEDLKDVIATVDIDSWIIRVKRKTLVTDETLDHFYVPLLVPGRGKRDIRIKQIPSGFINIYYSAAAISTRFEKFQCPAFDHDKEITNFEVKKIATQDKAITGSKQNAYYFPEKLKAYSYTPYPVNAGKEMNGEYHFEVALFNAKDKMIKSNWYELEEAVKVNSEKRVSISGCKNFKIPKNDSSIDDIQDFKFGR